MRAQSWLGSGNLTGEVVGWGEPSDQVSPSVDVNAVGGGLRSEGAVLLDKVSHCLLDVVFVVPLFLFFFLLLLLLHLIFWDRGGGRRGKLRLGLNLPDGG